MDISNKIAVVSGTSKGIGLALCEKLLAKNAIVYGLSRSGNTLQHANFHGIDVDVRNSAALEKIINEIIATHNAIDILVNNAGLGYFGYCEELSLAQWQEMFDTNVTAMFYLCKLAIPKMKENMNGHIVNIASTAALEGYVQVSGYCATKFAVKGFSDALYKEVREHGIKVTCIYPGSTKTDFFRHNENVKPHNNMMNPQEVAETIMYALETTNNYHPVNIEMRPLIVKPK